MIPLAQTTWPLEGIWASGIGFVGVMILAIGIVGLLSKSMSIPAMGSYLMFSYYGATADISILTNVSFVTHTVVVIGVAFKLWRLEGGGEM